MMTLARRQIRVYGAWAALVPKLFLAYSIWVWMEFFVQIIALIIFVAFWRGVYAGQDTIAGLTLAMTLNYILLAQLFQPLAQSSSLWYLGDLMRSGEIAVALVRPVDLQTANYVSTGTQVVIELILRLPLFALTWLLFDLVLPADPLIWLAFVLTAFLGWSLLYYFDWIISCAAFYSTEVWGMGVVRFGVASFFSGAFIPLDMMPDWLRAITGALPFAQALYLPVSLLTGITPLSEMPRLWLGQAAYLVLLIFLSRLVYRRAVRRITVQGG